MTVAGAAGLAAAVMACAWLLTGLVWRRVRSGNMLDIPNARSSHLTPTPRGGGLGMVAAASGALGLLAVSGYPQLMPLIIAPLAIALIGLADDFRSLSARLRLAVQSGAAVLLLVSLGAPAIVLGGWQVPAGIALVIALLWLVWMTNLYNFMDGIDSLASLYALAVGAAAALLQGLAGDPLWPAPLAVALAAAGFGTWNWPPARIFMGDTGSGWLGFMFAALALLSSQADPRLLWCWLILLALFISDATATLLVRLLRGETLYQAHRSHAYQRITQGWIEQAVGRGDSATQARRRAHRRFSLIAVAVVLGWLLPLAAAVILTPLEGLLASLVAYFPLLIVALYPRGEKLTGREG